MSNLSGRQATTRNASALCRRLFLVAPLLLALLIGSLTAALAQDGMPPMSGQGSTPAVATASVAVTFDHETDGIVTIVIPRGMEAQMMQTGNGDYRLPSVIRLHVGDTIILQNNDIAPHAILYAVLMPGQTNRRTLTKIGSEIYSAGCSAAAGSSDFTSIFVSAARPTLLPTPSSTETQ